MNGRVPIVLLIESDAIHRGTLARLLKAAGCCVIPVGRSHVEPVDVVMHVERVLQLAAHAHAEEAARPIGRRAREPLGVFP
jgi:hypothetical protein